MSIVYLIWQLNGPAFGTFVGQREGNSDRKVGGRMILKWTIKE